MNMNIKETIFIDVSEAVLENLDREYHQAILKADENPELREKRQEMMRDITAVIQKELFIRLIEGVYEHTDITDRFSDGNLEMSWIYDVSDQKCRITLEMNETEIDAKNVSAMYFRCRKENNRTEYRMAANMTKGTDTVLTVIRPFLDVLTSVMPVESAVIQMRKDLVKLEEAIKISETELLFRAGIIEKDIDRIREMMKTWPNAADVLLDVEDCADTIRDLKAKITAKTGRKTKA